MSHLFLAESNAEDMRVTAGKGYSVGFQGLEWEFIVINEPIPNAFVLPGGKVVVYTGLLRLLSNEDELAGVLAHEVAHVVARHAVRLPFFSLPPSPPRGIYLLKCLGGPGT
jgi:hypothetical protein